MSRFVYRCLICLLCGGALFAGESGLISLAMGPNPGKSQSVMAFASKTW